MGSAGTLAMLERTARFFLVLALLAAPLSGCAYMTTSGRQQLAYQRYVKKFSGRKAKVVKKYKKVKMPRIPGPSENRINTDVVDAPQSVTAGAPGN
jgi:hypothetical protein